MADAETTVLYPNKGVTFYLPGGVHGFSRTDVGVPVRNEHAKALIVAGGVETGVQRKARLDLAAAEAEKAAAEKAEAEQTAAASTAPAADGDHPAAL